MFSRPYAVQDFIFKYIVCHGLLYINYEMNKIHPSNSSQCPVIPYVWLCAE